MGFYSEAVCGVPQKPKEVPFARIRAVFAAFKGRIYESKETLLDTLDAMRAYSKAAELYERINPKKAAKFYEKAGDISQSLYLYIFYHAGAVSYYEKAAGLLEPIDKMNAARILGKAANLDILLGATYASEAKGMISYRGPSAQKSGLMQSALLRYKNAEEKYLHAAGLAKGISPAMADEFKTMAAQVHAKMKVVISKTGTE